MIGTLFGASREEKVLALLDAERAVILKGPLGDLAGLVARREAEVAELLAAGTPDESFLSALKIRAERNSRLLLASLAGARAAAETVERGRRDASRLRTYSADGHPVELGGADITRDKRA